MSINWDDVSDETKEYLEENPELAPTLIDVAERLKAKWSKP
ncbi:hypothetical protein [Curtobacterium sp. MCBA15_008]|nr:hypothetical protein [Curtobacterium sp. MCBA15_008]